jgi:hypothetical protein
MRKLRVLFVLLLIGGAVFGQGATKSGGRIPYKIVFESAVKGGPHNCYIVISPANRNEADIKALGKELLTDPQKQYYQVFFLVFDDEKAASLLWKALLDNRDLTDAEGAFVDNHELGSYTRYPSGISETRPRGSRKTRKKIGKRPSLFARSMKTRSPWTRENCSAGRSMRMSYMKTGMRKTKCAKTEHISTPLK